MTITAFVANNGLEDATGVVVRFYAGDPSTSSGQVPSGGVQIGADQVLPTLAINSTAQSSIAASFAGTGGKKIFVIADTDNLISEKKRLSDAELKIGHVEYRGPVLGNEVRLF